MTDAGAGGESAPGRADAAPERADAADGQDAPYRGLPGAFVYALRESESLLFRSYVVVAVLLSLAVALLVGLGVVTLVAGTVGGGGLLNLSRAFLVIVGLGVLAPVLAPVLLVARHTRREGGDTRYDRAMALGGYLAVASLYVGLVTTVPPAQQDPVTGPLAPVVEFLYALPPAAGVVPPLSAVGLLVALHRTRG